MDELTCDDLPDRPSEELIQWARQKLIGDIHALVYRSGWYRDPMTDIREECVDTICSACGENMKLSKIRAGECCSSYAPAPFGFLGYGGEQVIHRQQTICPCCGAKAEAVHIGRINGYYTLRNCWPLEVCAINGRLALICWYIRLEVDKAGEEQISAFPYLAYVVEQRKINFFSGYIKWYTTLKLLNHWESRAKYKDHFGKAEGVFPWNKRILEGTTAENSKLDLYMKCKGDLYPVSYLKLWLRRPQVENLLMQGVGNILAEMICRDCTAHSYYDGASNIPHLKDVNWKEKRPAQMLGLSKEEFRHARADGWTLAELEVYRDIRNRGVRINPDADMKLIRKVSAGTMKRLLRECDDFPVMKTVRYLLKDKKRDAGMLIDYWRMAVTNGSNLNDSDVRFPQNLKNAHDAEDARQRMIKDEAISKAFVKRYDVLMPYAFEADGLLIRPAATPEELFEEGEKLHHCVYSYRENHANGKTAIFLIRKTDAPDVPYFTLEFDEAGITVRQNRGKHNCSRTAEVRAFEDKWLDWVKEQKYERSKSA